MRGSVGARRYLLCELRDEMESDGPPVTMSAAMMFTRVSLLLMVTGLFAAMWSGDSPDDRSGAEIRLARLASSPQASLYCGFGNNARAKIDTISASSSSKSDYPIPEGIAPGKYLVVNQAGRTWSVTISEDSQSSVKRTPEDHYLVIQGSLRWHFIRLATQEHVLALPVDQGPAANLQ